MDVSYPDNYPDNPLGTRSRRVDVYYVCSRYERLLSNTLFHFVLKIMRFFTLKVMVYKNVGVKLDR